MRMVYTQLQPARSLPSCATSALRLPFPAHLLHPSSSSPCFCVLLLLVCCRRAQGMQSPALTSRWCLTTRTDASRCVELWIGKGWQNGGDRRAIKGWDKGPGAAVMVLGQSCRGGLKTAAGPTAVTVAAGMAGAAGAEGVAGAVRATGATGAQAGRTCHHIAQHASGTLARSSSAPGRGSASYSYPGNHILDMIPITCSLHPRRLTPLPPCRSLPALPLASCW